MSWKKNILDNFFINFVDKCRLNVNTHSLTEEVGSISAKDRKKMCARNLRAILKKKKLSTWNHTCTAFASLVADMWTPTLFWFSFFTINSQFFVEVLFWFSFFYFFSVSFFRNNFTLIDDYFNIDFCYKNSVYPIP